MADNRLHKLISDGGATWMTWCNLRDLRLIEGDIKKAVAAFREKTKKEAMAIGLNPRNKELAGEAGDGIQVSYYSYILLWEIWMSANPVDNFVPHRPPIRKAAAQLAIECNISQARPKAPVGRPKADFPVERALRMRADGLGLRDIAEILHTSHMTVSRALRKAEEDARN